MKFKIIRTSDWRGEKKPVEEAYRDGNRWVIDIKDFDHLLSFMEKHGQDQIVIQDNRPVDIVLEIYDDWRE